ncbi:MAG: hypothetical protein K0Q87_4569, partial [Neobacillus sp.]|nr:hypothetical protein [Neobacillus sp.]
YEAAVYSWTDKKLGIGIQKNRGVFAIKV